MDKIDKKIITLLQQNARMPLKALAENVFLSSPAVSARIERLEKEEIIEGYEVKINQLKLGYHITAFINLEVAPVQKPDFYPFIKSCPLFSLPVLSDFLIFQMPAPQISGKVLRTLFQIRSCFSALWYNF